MAYAGLGGSTFKHTSPSQTPSHVIFAALHESQSADTLAEPLLSMFTFSGLPEVRIAF
jgi:hypothetical protein